MRVLVGCVAVLLGLCTMVMRRRRVFPGLLVPAMAVMVGCLTMVMGSCLVVARRGMMVFGRWMARCRRHLFLPEASTS